ncbi:AbrB family transcriptional regulator [Natronohydrobacter thiooxidans]|jgi:membrane AbrB-like protein|uniref:AbrB family transcriptional regulator n=1 Tax=Natronohydrobacter thiooxidans TaxID=87172 RepID=UPI000A033B64|nr:AbrB family transcriptional regulator [Natronohydrobacter thiooxidans]
MSGTDFRQAFGKLLHVVKVMAGAVLFGFVAKWLNFPLPWMLGAMVFTGTVRLMDFSVRVPVQTRQLGQILIASSVGLSFTPDALQVMGALAVPMAMSAILTILLSFGVASILRKLTKVGASTAILATLPLGPVESAVLAQKFGVASGPIVFAQTTRIVFLVVLIPPVIVLLDGNVSDPVAVLRGMEWSAIGALLLFAFGLTGALLLKWLNASNPFFLGALGAAAISAVLGLPVSAYPYLVLVTAQIFLGIWLGAAIDRDLFRKAGGFLPGSVLTSFMMIFLCALMGLSIAFLTGQPWQVMVLATAPGSVTEMALTAKILQDGLALVTAFHIMRIFIILPFSGLLVEQALYLLGTDRE